MSKVRIGASTIAVWIAAAAAAVGAGAQILGDHAPWLAAVSAALIALNNGWRSWQATLDEADSGSNGGTT